MNNPKIKTQTVGNPTVCCICGRNLIPDESALTKKLVNRGAVEYMCLSCLSAHFGVPEDALRDKIRQFREMGCTLFM